MQSRAAALTLLLFTAGLAGCVSDDPPADEGLEPASQEPVNDGPPPDEDTGPASNETAPEPQEPSAAPEPPKTVEPLGPMPFTMDGFDCTETLLMVPVPLAAARTVVPDTYTPLLSDTGMAVVIAGLKECGELVIDGVSIGAGSTSDVGVLIEAPNGGDAFNYYQAWWPTDNVLLAHRLASLGWRAPVVGDTSSYLGALDTVAQRTFTVPWAEGTYSGTAVAGEPPVPQVTDAVGWFDGPLGTTTVTKTLTSRSFGGGVGVLEADAGSPMAGLLGGTEGEGVALMSGYDMLGRVEIVEG